MSKDKKDKIIEIGIIGDTQTGKTSLINYYNESGFMEQITPTVGIDTYVKTIKYRKNEYKLKIIDTAGQEQYHSLALNIFKQCKGLILVYAIDNEPSFENIKNEWIEDINNAFDISKIPVILVGNKKDLKHNRIISEEEGKEVANKNNFMFSETSAKTGENVNKIFQDLFEFIVNGIEIIDYSNIKKNENKNDEKKNKEIKIIEKKNKDNKSGCIIF